MSDECAVGPDGKLRDAKDIVFYHDADDLIPIGASAMKRPTKASATPHIQLMYTAEDVKDPHTGKITLRHYIQCVRISHGLIIRAFGIPVGRRLFQSNASTRVKRSGTAGEAASEVRGATRILAFVIPTLSVWAVRPDTFALTLLREMVPHLLPLHRQSASRAAVEVGLEREARHLGSRLRGVTRDLERPVWVLCAYLGGFGYLVDGAGHGLRHPRLPLLAVAGNMGVNVVGVERHLAFETHEEGQLLVDRNRDRS
ncbi:hypothetical protein B0H13DRAFT_1907951 [Mycena leptocephala]|nr:hypothetical protein B0H13DRAFT_1907951 [Mycena leptocephala]